MEAELKDKRQLAVMSFMRTDMLHKKVCEKRTAKLGIHRSQHMMLMRLSRFNRAVTQKELASELSISAAAAAVTIKKLEDAGLIARTAGGDRRCNEVVITKKGSEIVEQSKRIFEEINSRMTDGVSDEELESFIETINKMQDNLKGVKR